MKKLIIIAATCVAILAVSAYGLSASIATSENILAFCGSASKPALEEAAATFENETGIKVELQFGGSGTVLSQMEISETGDLFIPGSPDYLIKAIDDNVVYPDTTEALVYLVPAIITTEGNPKNITCLEDLAGPGITVGIGDPESVCVGQYAVAVLENAGLYEAVSKNIVVHAESCAKTASLVAMGSVDAVIGWRVFHYWNPEKTEVVYINPEHLPGISYVPAAVSRYTKNFDMAKQFIDFLTSSEGKSIFQKYGYLATEAEAREYAPEAVILMP